MLKVMFFFVSTVLRVWCSFDARATLNFKRASTCTPLRTHVFEAWPYVRVCVCVCIVRMCTCVWWLGAGTYEAHQAGLPIANLCRDGPLEPVAAQLYFLHGSNVEQGEGQRT